MKSQYHFLECVGCTLPISCLESFTFRLLIVTLVEGLLTFIKVRVDVCGRPVGKSDTLKGKHLISCPDLLFSHV